MELSSNFQFDVFLTCSPGDEALVREVAGRLQRDGLRVQCGEWKFRPGGSIPAEIEEWVRCSRVLVLCLPGQANASGSPSDRGRWLVPTRLDQPSGKEDLWIRWGPEESDRDYGKLLEACRSPKILPFPARGDAVSANVVSSRKLSFMIPGRNFPPRRPTRRENVNESIRVREVRAVFPDGTAEVMPTAMALRKAQELGLDLVLVSPTAVPPVAKAIDYGHYQYELKKKQHDARKKQHVVQVKELKFRPNTDDHDYDFKKNHAIRFLKEGNRVKAVVQFRGREIAHTDLGKKLLVRFAEDLASFGAVEGMPRLEGRNAHILISPTKAVAQKAEKPEKPPPPDKQA